MKPVTIALVGNPNCGKTTLFNALTGSRQRIGNWPGVTVERKTGHYAHDKGSVAVVDLPGVYSLVSSNAASLDERIASDYVASHQADVIVNIIDAAHLERSLYLTLQLLEMKVPVIVAINMLDVAQHHGMKIDIKMLEERLQCPIVAIQANRKKGLEKLKHAIDAVSVPQFHLTYPSVVERAIETLSMMPRWLATRCLEGDVLRDEYKSCANTVADCQHAVAQELHEDCDIVIADSRYAFITSVTKEVIKKRSKSPSFTQKIDRWALHRVWGIPLFFAVMCAMFFFAITVGGYFQDFFDEGSNAILVDGLANWMSAHSFPPSVIAIVAFGIGKGINTTVTFIPVLAFMFLFLSFLENSGYMMRAAFVVDRFMRAMGLPGKSFVPLIVGFGCNVPAIMGARTLENKRDRILTVIMAPFMSCSARLAIYAVFIAAFFKTGGVWVVFALYFMGVLMGVLTGLLLRKTVLLGESSPLVMELPPYHWPVTSMMILDMWQRLKGFIIRAGRFIVPICALITVLNSVTLQGEWMTEEATTSSVLAIAGKSVTPVFAPMGVNEDNWPATVGLLTGMLAKEVVIGTLNTLYAQESGSAMGQLAQYFDGRVGAFAYLLFILLYVPCVSAIAAIRREVSRGWAWFSIGWNTVVAYGVAVGFYQIATFLQHPLQSGLWLIGLAGTFFAAVIGLKLKGLRQRGLWEPAVSEGKA